MFLVQVKSQFLLDKSCVCEKTSQVLLLYIIHIIIHIISIHIVGYVCHHLPLCPQFWRVLYPPSIGMLNIVSHDICGLYKVLPPSYVNWYFKATINPSDTSEVEQLG